MRNTNIISFGISSLIHVGLFSLAIGPVTNAVEKAKAFDISFHFEELGSGAGQLAGAPQEEVYLQEEVQIEEQPELIEKKEEKKEEKKVEKKIVKKPQPPALVANNTTQTESTATPGNGGNQINVGDAKANIGFASYQQLVVALLAKQKKYPDRARRLGIEGTTYLALVLNNEGKVVEAGIAKESGSEILDKEVLRMLKAAQDKFPAPPAGEMVKLKVPVQFKLQG